jgi:hypothetical protein
MFYLILHFKNFDKLFSIFWHKKKCPKICFGQYLEIHMK